MASIPMPDSELQPRPTRRGLRASDHWPLILAVALILIVPVDRARGAAQATQTITGQFLVATDEMGDPRFARTVVFMVEHGPQGAMGLVINRPLREVPLAELMEEADPDAPRPSGTVLLHYGGPVEPGRGFVLHSSDYRSDATHEVAHGISFTADARILEVLGSKNGPKQHLVALGYAGWSPGQLEAEIAAGAWIVVPADPGLLFDPQADTKWERAMARRTTIL